MRTRALLLLGSIILAACSRPQASPAAAVPAEVAGGAGNLTRVDSQGPVSIQLTPIKMEVGGASLEFDVAMNTHSVDLSMDLASLATLSTDAGAKVTATRWTGSPGGHHVRGVLDFPGSYAGKPILDGALLLTVTIVDVAAPVRVFEWELSAP